MHEERIVPSQNPIQYNISPKGFLDNNDNNNNSNNNNNNNNKRFRVRQSPTPWFKGALQTIILRVNFA